MPMLEYEPMDACLDVMAAQSGDCPGSTSPEAETVASLGSPIIHSDPGIDDEDADGTVSDNIAGAAGAAEGEDEDDLDSDKNPVFSVNGDHPEAGPPASPSGAAAPESSPISAH